jgi:PucR family transcriptional regulator, purine catabolism regulatory protein
MKNENVLTLQDILNRTLFQHAKLVAGIKGVSRNVGWIHILEITTASFTNKHDLILTTGLGIHENASDQMIYLQELIRNEAAGLCIELGQYFQSVPQDMIDLANQYNFPLIVFEKPVRFVDITQDIHSLLINQQHQILKDLELFSRKLQQLTLKSSDIQAVLRLLHNQIHSQVVYFSLTDKHKFVPPVPHKMAQDIVTVYWNELKKKNVSTQETILHTLSDTRIILSQPVICLGQTLSYVGVILHHDKTTDFQMLLLDHVGKAVAHILLRKLFLEEKTLGNHAQLINDLLQNKMVNEEHALARIGLRPANKGGYLFIAGIIEIEHDLMRDEEHEIESRNQDILVLIRSLLKKLGIYNLLLIKNNQIFILCIRESFSDTITSKIVKELLLQLIEQLKNSINHNISKHIKILSGFGNFKQRLADISQSFKETYDTLAVTRILPSISPFYEELGIYQILKGVPDHELLNSFIAYNLGVIIECDKTNNSNLLQTLAEYLKCMGSKQETAERLFIHRQTLYYRLGKLEELLGKDFLKPEKRICLELALYAYQIVHPLTRVNDLVEK